MIGVKKTEVASRCDRPEPHAQGQWRLDRGTMRAGGRQRQDPTWWQGDNGGGRMSTCKWSAWECVSCARASVPRLQKKLQRRVASRKGDRVSSESSERKMIQKEHEHEQDPCLRQSEGLLYVESPDGRGGLSLSRRLTLRGCRTSCKGRWASGGALVGALWVRNIQDNTCAVERRCKDNRRREPEKIKGRGTQKRGSGECQSCWPKTDILREEGGMAEARAAVTLSSTRS